MTASNNTFCALAWLHFHLMPSGRATICCQSQESLFDEGGAETSVKTHTLAEIWNSENMREIRHKMRVGERVPNCEACYDNERIGAWSYRQSSNKLWLQDHPNANNICNALDRVAATEVAPLPISADIRLGNLCNLKCRVCNGQYSSQIARDPIHTLWNGAPPPTPNSRFQEDDWSVSPKLLEEIKDFFPNIEWIQLAGGEPSINKTQIGWLEHLRDTGISKDISLEVFTNFTTNNASFFDLLSCFKKVNLHLSIDGFGAMNEYLRFPSKWASIERNATYIQKYLGLFEVSVTPVINAYNALSIVDLFRWAEQRSYRSFISLGRGIEQMDLRRLPPEALADVRKRWFAYVDEQDARSHNLSDDDRTNARKLRAQMESIFAELADPEVVHKNRATFSDFMKFTNDMDSSRKQCFATVSPETYRYFIAHYGAWKSDTEFLGTSPAHTTPVLSAVPDMVTALDRHKVGDLATAEFLYRCALEKAPEEVAPRFMLALLLFQKSPVKHRDEVEKHLNAVIGSTVANAELRHGAASVLKALPPQPPAA